MELDPRLQQRLRRWLPRWLVAALDPVDDLIERSTRELAATLPTGSRVLDAGCGEGRHRAHFTRTRYVGVDRGVGDSRWDYSRVDIRGDLGELPFRDEVFDAALCLVVLEHVPAPADVLGEMRRVMRPGGQMLLVVPLLWEVHQAPNDYFRFTRFGIEKLLLQSGFAIDTLTPIGGFFTLMARRCVNALSFFQGSWRWILFVLLAPWLGAVFPLLLRALDRLDRERHFTLGYRILARRRE